MSTSLPIGPRDKIAPTAKAPTSFVNSEVSQKFGYDKICLEVKVCLRVLNVFKHSELKLKVTFFFKNGL